MNKPAMSDTQDGLLEQVGQAIHNLMAGNPETDWNDSREIDRMAEVVIELCRAHFQRQAEPVADVMYALSDGSIGKEIAPRKWTTYKQELAKLIEHPWVKNGVAKIIPLYTSPPIPADMVMVPREPTEERLKRGVRAFQSGFNGTDNLSDWLAFWQAMITDAPANKEG